MKTKSLHFSLSLITLGICHAAMAADQPAANSVELAPMTIQGDVLGAASDQEVRTYAGSRSVIDSSDLKKASARGLDDALQRVPGIKIFDETGTGALPQISVRGLYESRSGRIQALSDGTSSRPLSPPVQSLRV